MTSEEYWEVFRVRRGIVPKSFGITRDGNIMCCDMNQTEFEIPDPLETPEDARAELLERVLANLGSLVIPS